MSTIFFNWRVKKLDKLQIEFYLVTQLRCQIKSFFSNSELGGRRLGNLEGGNKIKAKELGVFVLAAMLVLPTVTAWAQPTEVWVDNDYTAATPGWGVTHFDKIQDGIDAAATPGGTVHVAAGTYTKNITIDKNLTLTGAVMATTRIQASRKRTGSNDDGVIVVDGAEVDLSGFTVDGNSPTYNTQNGIVCINGASGRIHHNTVQNIYNGTLRGQGIRCIDSNPDIMDNTVQRYERDAIYMRGTGIDNTVQVTGNTVIGQGFPVNNGRMNKGIVLYNGASPTVSSNMISDCHEGTQKYGKWSNPAIEVLTVNILPNFVATSPIIHDNTISDSRIGISVLGNLGSLPQITDNTLTDITNAGITYHTDFSSVLGTVVITGNTVSNITADRGIWVLAPSPGAVVRYTIDNNTITNCKWGITADGGNAASTINGNTIDCNNIALSLGIEPYTKANGVTVSGNTISNGAYGGIEIRGSNISNDGNDISGCNEGIVDRGTNNTIQNDNIHDNSRGITVRGTGLTIQKCDITGNIVVGIENRGTNTIITKNNFSGNNVLMANRTDTGMIVNYNNFDGTNSWGLEQRLASPIDARYNWWGDASGPGVPGYPGPGDKICHYGVGVGRVVDYSPWLGQNPITGNVPSISDAAHPWDWYVNTSNASTIQEAIDVAIGGDTISVAAGTYNENVIVNKQLTLQAASTPIVDGGLSPGGGTPAPDAACIDITADDVTIDGFIVQHSEHGIKGTNRANCVIKNCEARENYGQTPSTNNGGIGIMFNGTTDSDNNQILNCSIHDNERMGIWLQGGRGHLIDGNRVYDNGVVGPQPYGIGTWQLDATTFSDNEIRNNGAYGVTLGAATNTTFESNLVENHTIGVYLYSSSSVSSMSYNSFSGNSNYGIYNSDATMVNAKCNWWGYASGPGGPHGRTDPADEKEVSKGDAVSANVDWNPWLPQPVRFTP